ncbi:DNA/RNA non-specific endonuclease [Raoultibacter timonensis]|uniref:DNA/RNA non-specific endonuclease n=1 Tax=Raoultibacter timonensis TaxID=1907662 RepID=UPI0026DAF90A|nr:DNA/RNA non-specific endonuclease [Raoultibacter timonensis]
MPNLARQFLASALALALAAALALTGCSQTPVSPDQAQGLERAESFALSEIPEYAGEPSVAIDGGQPGFTDEDIDAAKAGGIESYSDLDAIGRCGAAFVLVGPETMPTEKREGIGMVKPSGWQISTYDFIDGRYLYNRCHLVGFQLTGENANERNLITGTRYLNTQGMLPLENDVADYVEETGNHVLFRATPIFNDDELIARGVQLEALSVEDGGAGVRFNEYCYNVQPNVEIDYLTGNNREIGAGETDADAEESTYVLNTRSMKFHEPDCKSVADMAEHNKQEFTGARTELLEGGYEPCGRCDP